MSIIIRGGTVKNAGGVRADVLIADGKIVDVGLDLDARRVSRDRCWRRLRHAGGRSPHPHGAPFMGTVASEDFFTGTSGLLPAARPCASTRYSIAPENIIDAWKKWRGWAEKAATDTFHVAITWWDASVSEDMGTLVRDYGVNSFKHFMAYKNAIMCDDETLVNSFKRCRELGALATLHAENGELVYTLQQDIYDKGIHGPEGHPLSRPPEVEGEAANRAIRIAEVLGVPVYLVHTSCIDALQVVTRAKLEGQRVFGIGAAPGR